MHGYAALAGALLTTFAFLGAGAGDSLMDNLDRRTESLGDGDQRQAYKPQEQVVEGHTTFAVLNVEEFVAPPPPEPKREKIECEQFQPTDPVWPIYERCDVSVGPIDTPTDYYVEEVAAKVNVTNNGLPVVGNPDEGFWDTVFGYIPFL